VVLPVPEKRNDASGAFRLARTSQTQTWLTRFCSRIVLAGGSVYHRALTTSEVPTLVTDPAQFPFSNATEPRHCPSCGTKATNHVAGECLDRWVHESFLGRSLAKHETPPPYSSLPQHPCLQDVINALKWSESVAVMQTSDGCTVGLHVGRSGDYLHFEVLVSADRLPLAVCRAAVCGLATGGENPLVIV
jgi:hypothetical protein